MSTEAAYLAGIIDGEGTITIHRHKQHGRVTYQLRPRLIVSNTDMRLMRHLEGRYGGRIVAAQPKPRHKQAFLWRVCGMADILKLVEDVRPHLIVKAAQADAMLSFIRSRAAKNAVKAGAPYSDAEMAAYWTMFTLNRRQAT